MITVGPNDGNNLFAHFLIANLDFSNAGGASGLRI
jgi:hypothetical protein